MIATSRSFSAHAATVGDAANDWQTGFLRLLPRIERGLRIEFRRLAPEPQDEAVQEALVGALAAYRRLHQQGRGHLAYPTVLARFAARRVRVGRRAAAPANSRDVLSTSAQQKHGFFVERLDGLDESSGAWREILVEDRRAGPAETAAMRIDYAAFRASLPTRQQQMADALAEGESTQVVARRFRVSPTRISQIRGELRASWAVLQGESEAA